LLEDKRLKSWHDNYWNQIKRNIGIISIAEQDKIKKAKIAIFGVGGLGGAIVDQLVRCGCENIVICDNDKFEETNLNRQICTREDLGFFKVDIVEKFLKSINPNVIVNKFYEINEQNIHSILKDVKIVTLTLDDPFVSILIARECLKKKIPIIESYAIPYLCSWWFTSESVSYENFYNLRTEKMPYNEIAHSKVIQKEIKAAILAKLTKLPKIAEFFDREKDVFNAMLSGEIPLVSLAPIVRISASYLAFEIIYSGLLNIKRKILAPEITGFDYLRMRLFKV
jgi:hypothetical protein